MDLKAFERGARLLFSLPSSKTISALTIASIAAALYFNCNPIFVIYASLVLPLQMLLCAPGLLTVRRAYGFTPLVLLWGTLASKLSGFTPLIFLPPALLFGTVIRYLSYSRTRYLSFPASALAMAIACGLNSAQLVAAWLMMVASVLANELFVRKLERSMAGYGAREAVTAYLRYTLVHDRLALENFLEKLSVQKSGTVYVVDLLQDDRVTGMIIVPHIHPGPFRDIGSSRLPSMLTALSQRRGFPCLVLHGASTHGEDLVYAQEAEKLANLVVDGGGTTICEGESLGVGEYRNRFFRVVALAFECGTTFALVERLDGGMEDIPLALAAQLKDAILIDAHNSFDEPRPSPLPESELGKHLIDSAAKAVLAARASVRRGWYAALSTRPGRIGDEVGSAGVSLLRMSNGQQEYVVVSFDSNSMMRSFRDSLYSRLSHLGANLVLATSDTHELTGTRAGNTYHPLGWRVDAEECARIVASLHHTAQPLYPLRYRIRLVVFDSKYLDSGRLEHLNSVIESLLLNALLLFLIHFSFFAVPFLIH